MSEATYLDIEMTDIASETTHPDAEMMDIGCENQDLHPTDQNLNPPPSQSVMADGRNADGPNNCDELLETLPDRLAPPIIVGSDTDTDLSDDEDDTDSSENDNGTHQSRQESATPPGR
jgi:hypothetical protein